MPVDPWEMFHIGPFKSPFKRFKNLKKSTATHLGQSEKKSTKGFTSEKAFLHCLSPNFFFPNEACVLI